MLRLIKLFIFFGLLLCSTINAFAADQFSLATNGKFILPPSVAAGVLKQCSRDAPKNTAGYWYPTDELIADLEKRLLRFLALREKKGQSAPSKTFHYHRQYVGFESGGKQFVYGNFYPHFSFVDLPEKSEPTIFCDGGIDFLGIVFNIKTKEFSELKFNGSN